MAGHQLGQRRPTGAGRIVAVVEEGVAGNRPVGADGARVLADAVAVVVEHRLLDRELAALAVVLADAQAGPGERLPHRDARVLVEVGFGLAEGLDEEAREDGLVALDAAVGRGDDDAPLTGQA